LGKRERALLRPGKFRGRVLVMDAGDVQRAVWRIAHEILERNRGTEGLVLVGLQSGGVWLAKELAKAVAAASGSEAGRAVPVGALDVAYYRDDIGLRPVLPVAATDVPVALDEAVVVLCDDVIFTGRTVRAALNALMDIGRPAAVQLAVMVDRGYRELPVRPDYVGKNLPTRRDEMVDVSSEGVMLGEVVDEVSAGGQS
jgi:pyrimidine operon attenuation protein/uracil phosphoribosyltransferase